jgi:hypothetical protein
MYNQPFLNCNAVNCRYCYDFNLQLEAAFSLNEDEAQQLEQNNSYSGTPVQVSVVTVEDTHPKSG